MLPCNDYSVNNDETPFSRPVFLVVLMAVVVMAESYSFVVLPGSGHIPFVDLRREELNVPRSILPASRLLFSSLLSDALDQNGLGGERLPAPNTLHGFPLVRLWA